MRADESIAIGIRVGAVECAADVIVPLGKEAVGPVKVRRDQSRWPLDARELAVGIVSVTSRFTHSVRDEGHVVFVIVDVRRIGHSIGTNLEYKSMLFPA